MELFIGITLAEARKQKKLSLKKISQETNISIKYLQAMEEENFRIFPAEVYLKGFLRSYGKYLNLDTAQLLQAYEMQHGRPAAENIIIKEKAIAAPKHAMRYWLVALAGLLLTLLIWVWRSR